MFSTIKLEDYFEFDSAEPTNKQEITEAINQLYSLIDLSKPIIYFCDRPTYTREVLLDCGLDTFGSNLNITVCNILLEEIEDYIKLHLIDSLWESLNDELRIKNVDRKPFDSWNYLGDYLEGFYYDDISFCEGRVFHQLIRNGIIFDYCRSLIRGFNNRLEEIWLIFQTLVNNCSQVLFYENICIVYEKLKVLSVDDKGLLHNNGKPAIQFSDGTSFYACHGNIIPEQYGKIPLNQWKTQWLTKVDNFLRNILILGIGEDRICRELKTQEKINQVGVLSPNQKTLISEYRDKWRKIAFSTERCERSLVTKHINRAYKYLKVKPTKVIFFDSPLLAQKYAIDNN